LGTFCPEEAVMPQNITFNLDTGMTGEEQLSNLVVEDGGERPSWSHAWVAKALAIPGSHDPMGIPVHIQKKPKNW
jgi:hypothetical protein